MKTYARIVGTLGALSLLVAAHATADSVRLEARIPFTFTAGSTPMPAGVYSVSRMDNTPNLLLVRGTTKSVFFFTEGSESSEGRGKTRLVFHRYGDQFFLRQVWFPGNRGYTLPESQDERESAGRTIRRASQEVSVSIAAAPR